MTAVVSTGHKTLREWEFVQEELHWSFHIIFQEDRGGGLLLCRSCDFSVRATTQEGYVHRQPYEDRGLLEDTRMLRNISCGEKSVLHNEFTIKWQFQCINQERLNNATITFFFIFK